MLAVSGPCGDGRRRRLRVADDARPAHAVGGCRGHARAHARGRAARARARRRGRDRPRPCSRSPSTLRGLRGRSVRSLLARAPQEWGPPRGSRRTAWAIGLAIVAALLLAAAGFGSLGAHAAFFGAGALLLASALLFVSARLSGERQRARRRCHGDGRGARLPAGRVPPRPERPRRGARGLRLVRDRVRGRLPPHGPAGHRQDVRDRRLLAAGPLRAAAPPRPRHPRGPRGARARRRAGAREGAPHPLPPQARGGRELPQPVSARAADADRTRGRASWARDASRSRRAWPRPARRRPTPGCCSSAARRTGRSR